MAPRPRHPDEIKELPLSIGQLQFGRPDRPPWWRRLAAWVRGEPIAHDDHRD